MNDALGKLVNKDFEANETTKSLENEVSNINETDSEMVVYEETDPTTEEIVQTEAEESTDLNQEKQVENQEKSGILEEEYSDLKEKILKTQCAKLWGTNIEGSNQGLEHFVSYWDLYPERIPSLANRLGVSQDYFSKSVNGFENFTKKTIEVSNTGIKRDLNSKIIYYIEGIVNPKKGVIVIFKEGKIQSMMPGDLKSFNKLK